MQKYSRYIRTVIAVMSLTLALSARPVAAEESEPNTLSAEEKAAGWQLLFDGKTASQWRSFGKPDFPASGWQVAGGWLTKKTAEHPGNIVTREKFTDFEFSFKIYILRFISFIKKLTCSIIHCYIEHIIR